jgi:hypothetical protein
LNGWTHIRSDYAEIAAIADDMLLPDNVKTSLDRLRGERSGG